jgi:hypothetical protein
MATEHHPPEHGSEGYERSDADVRSLLRFGAALAILIALVMWGMVHTYNFFAKRESLGPPASPFENQRQLPPPPHLQPQPTTDLRRYCEIEQQELTTYGWVDQHAGIVRIPVDRAMEMVLQKGLPARPPNQSDQTSIYHVEIAGGIGRYTTDDTRNPMGLATQTQVMGVGGPCGYLVEAAGHPAESEHGKE